MYVQCCGAFGHSHTLVSLSPSALSARNANAFYISGEKWTSWPILPPSSFPRSLATTVLLLPTSSSCLTNAFRGSHLSSGSTVLVFTALPPRFLLLLLITLCFRRYLEWGFASSFNCLFDTCFASLFMYRTAQLRLCADGGANRVYDEMPLLVPHEDALDVRHRFSVSSPNLLLYCIYMSWNYWWFSCLVKQSNFCVVLDQISNEILYESRCSWHEVNWMRYSFPLWVWNCIKLPAT